MIRINLLPEVKRKAPKRKTKVARQIPYTWIVVALIAVVMAGFVTWLYHTKLTEKLEERQKQAAAIQKDIEKYKIQQSLVETARKQRNALAQKLEIIASLKRQQTGPVRLLDEMASAIPAKLWLQEMSSSGSSLTITGYAIDHIQIAAFMENLKKSKVFHNVELISAIADRAGSRRGAPGLSPVPVKNFELTCNVASVVRAK
ncbi:MAG: PilN domain-containing protein [Candidatus Lernaella stagnicola]|nr:PilN domain-containing protein [Candidatus Lernaella stagnicola]